MEAKPDHEQAKQAILAVETQLAAQTGVTPAAPPTAPTTAAPAAAEEPELAPTPDPVTSPAPDLAPDLAPAPAPSPAPVPSLAAAATGSSFQRKKSVTGGDDLDLSSLSMAGNTEVEMAMTFPYEQLTKGNTFPEGVNEAQREKYLSEAEFQQYLKCTREEFQSLPKWKQTKKKKDAELFW